MAYRRVTGHLQISETRKGRVWYVKTRVPVRVCRGPAESLDHSDLAWNPQIIASCGTTPLTLAPEASRETPLTRSQRRTEPHQLQALADSRQEDAPDAHIRAGTRRRSS
jgi:hypothetical protein